MKRGDVWYVDLEPMQGPETNKTRPVVIVTNEAANRQATDRGRGVITVVPLASNCAHVYPFQVLLEENETGLPRQSKAQAEQIRAVDVRRFVNHVGRLSSDKLHQLDLAIKLHLSL